ncbi:MAG TPA: winged helix-turn-helix domain-containing protein [Pyrinomonadaceae bacterium]|nr:winged helix-turn-helix domain-containing protein [Pyrinomonadaceae bacterium]
MNAKVYSFGHFRLDAAARKLFREEGVVPLTPRLFDILLLLVERNGQLVTKEDLMRNVWPNLFVEANNLTVSMSALRRALGESRAGREYIETIPKRGYRFVSRVIEEEAAAQSEKRVSREQRGADAHGDTVSSLAVLPFTNLEEDENLNYFVDGVTETIINSLSRLPQLRVLARSSVFRFRHREIEPKAAGAELGVEAVLVGTVRQVQGLLIIGVELVKVLDGSQLWGERYERKLSDIFAVQREITEEISRSLQLKLTSEQKRRLGNYYTNNIEAYNLYLKGRYFWNKRTETGIRKGIQYFEEAIKVDESYAPAYAGLGACYLSLTSWNILPAEEVLPPARRAATRALEMDDSFAEAHAVLGIVNLYSLDWPNAKSEFERALALDPNSAQVYFWYCTYWAIMGEIDEALAVIHRSQLLDPLSPVVCMKIGKTLLFKQQYAEALQYCYQALELDENFAWAYGMIGLIHCEQGDYEKAIREYRKCIALTRDTETEGLLGYVYAVAGRLDEATAILEKLQQQSRESYVPMFSTLFIYIGLKDKENAFRLLERMYEERSFMLAGLKMFPVFAYLRDDPRFSSILRRIGLPE